jgi:hypothetical protein
VLIAEMMDYRLNGATRGASPILFVMYDSKSEKQKVHITINYVYTSKIQIRFSVYLVLHGNLSICELNNRRK